MWWKKTTKPTDSKSVAYYRHSMRDCQGNSIPIQQEQVKQFAVKHGLDITREFTHENNSQASSEVGENLKKIIEMMTDSFGEFDCAFLLDTSKWELCRDVNPSDRHHVVFQEYGKIVMFCISYCERKKR